MENSVKEKIENLINESEVMLFMKGTPEMPQCGFSAAVVGVLNHLGVDYKTSNVLQDQDIREGIKEYSDWPTIPQLYVKKEFVGGCDIIREMHENGELVSFFEEKNIINETRSISDAYFQESLNFLKKLDGVNTQELAQLVNFIEKRTF